MPQVSRKKKTEKDPLQKAIPKNPRYADVMATVDTGASLSSYMRKINESGENFKIKPGEIFRRMKMTRFVQLVIQVAETNYPTFRTDSSIEGDNEFEGSCSSEKQCNNQRSFVETSVKLRPSLQSVITGIGECDINGKVKKEEKNSKISEVKSPDCPYLLLDLRDKDEFDSCHIIKAISYPHTMLSRCTNFEIREMLSYRNKPGHIIICYDEDESIGPRVATILVERGYENVFLLSGGLKFAWKLFPKGLILGDAPATLKKSQPSTKKMRSSLSTPRLSSASNAGSILSTRGSVFDDGASSVCGASTIGGRSVTSSVRRAIRYTFDTYDAVGSRGSPNGGEEFSMMDLTHLQLTLDNLLAAASSIAVLPSNDFQLATLELSTSFFSPLSIPFSQPKTSDFSSTSKLN